MQTHGPILAVDDDEDDMNIMRLLLRKAGVPHPTQLYRRGEDLMTALSDSLRKSVRAMLPVLCFLDLNMPEVSGYDVLRWIRNDARFDAMSVVMLSDSEDPVDIRRASAAGAQCYLAKYPHPLVLRRVVHEAEWMGSPGAAKAWFGVPANLMLRHVT